MKINTLRDVAVLSVLAAVLAAPASAQTPQPAPQAQDDQISQLAEMVGLSDEQEAEIRATVDEYTPQIQELQAEAQQAQQALQAQAGPDFDEDEIRESAQRFGELTGELMALNVIMQSTIESKFTDEQRQALETQMQQQQEAQQRQQRQMQEQIQEQLRREQEQQ